MFGRAAIRLGIGPHSSLICFLIILQICNVDIITGQLQLILTRKNFNRCRICIENIGYISKISKISNTVDIFDIWENICDIFQPCHSSIIHNNSSEVDLPLIKPNGFCWNSYFKKKSIRWYLTVDSINLQIRTQKEKFTDLRGRMNCFVRWR